MRFQYTSIFLTFLISCRNSSEVNLASSLESDSYKDSIAMIKEIEEEAKPAYIEAYTTVHEVKNYIELAEKGLVNISQVISDYNRRLGPVMGRLKTLKQIRERLDTSGEGYIQFMYVKAKADIASKKTAEKVFIINSIDTTVK